MSTPSPRRRTGRPPVTSRADILTAARAIIDREGWERLTIRRLATELGIGATTMYHHVRDKEDLLVQLLNEHASQRRRPRLPQDPRIRIVAAASAMHDALAEWPWAADVLTADGFVGRLDTSALWMVETIVAGAVDCGCSTKRAVDVFRSVWYYTVGEILVRAHSTPPGKTAARPAPHNPSFSAFDATELPHLAGIGKRWPQLAARDTYREGLEAIVDGLLARWGRV